MQCCVHVIDTVASWQQILQFTIDIDCLDDNGAKIVLKGLSRHPQLTVSMTWTQYCMLDSRNGISNFQSLDITLFWDLNWGMANYHCGLCNAMPFLFPVVSYLWTSKALK